MHQFLSRKSLALGAALLAAALLPFAPVGCGEGEEAARDTSPEGYNRIIYAVRQHTTTGADGKVSITVSQGMDQVMDYKRYVPGGRLELLEPSTGKVVNLTAAFPNADVSSLDLDHSATRAVFSMKTGPDDDYHLYVVNLVPDDSGAYPIRQLTAGPHDDLHPVWLAGERIAFITDQPYTEMGTRADEYNHSRIVSQIGTVTVEGGDGDRRLCSQNLSHTINLFALADGRVGFSRWEHLENINDVKLFAMNPDCTGMVALGGQHGKPATALAQMQETGERNVLLGIATSRNKTIQSGALVRVDLRGEGGIVDEENAKVESLTPAVPFGSEPSPIGRYRTPAPLPDGRILTSWAPGTVGEENDLSLTPPDFGVYIYDPATRKNRSVINYEGSWELYARPVVARPQPPLIGSIRNGNDATTPVRIGSIDVRQTSLGGTVSGGQFKDTPLAEALKQTTHVRIIEGFSSEIGGGMTMFGLTMAEGASLLGEAKVESDFSWLAEIPPFVPVHLQTVDEYGLAIRNQTLWIQGMPGEDRVCGGCHERRTQPFNPAQQALTVAAGRGPEKFVQGVLERTEYPWYKSRTANDANEVQRLFDAKCTSCHNETKNGSGPQEFYTLTATNAATGASTAFKIPRLDLSSRAITVTYDRGEAAWPASYVSLFYPAALEMEMNRGASITGTVPPMWAIPSDARGSALIEKLNAVSFKDGKRVAWKLGEPLTEGIRGGKRALHPEDVGGELTREERLMLIRAIDMGGQYYSRRNVDFKPFTADGSSGVEY